MRKDRLGIASGGDQRSRQAIEAEVRRKYEDELAATTDHWQKVSLAEKLEREIQERMEQVASPHSLWVRADSTSPRTANAKPPPEA